jgi:hypothetical protein
MADRFEFESASRILLARFNGVITGVSFGEFYRFAMSKVVATPATESRGTIIDLSKVTSFEVTPETIRALAWPRPADPDSSRLTIIVASAPNMFGLARMFASHGEDTRPRLYVVRTLVQAYAVFGVGSPHSHRSHSPVQSVLSTIQTRRVPPLRMPRL